MIRTINGTLNDIEFTYCASFEHILSDLKKTIQIENTNKIINDIDPELLYILRYDPIFNNSSNLSIVHPNEIINELKYLTKNINNVIIVNIIPPSLFPPTIYDYIKLKEISQLTKSHIIVNTSISVDNYPMTINSIYSTFERDLLYGIIKNKNSESSFIENNQYSCTAGFIYHEIKNYTKSLIDIDLIAIAKAQSTFHVPIFLSFSYHLNTKEIIHIFQIYLSILLQTQNNNNNNNMEKSDAYHSKDDTINIIFCNADVYCNNKEFLETLLNLKIHICFNMIGLKHVSNCAFINNEIISDILSSDKKIAKTIVRIFNKSKEYHKYVIISTGIYQKLQYRKCGGGGYGYIINIFKNYILSKAVSYSSSLYTCEMIFNLICKENIINILSWYKKPKLMELPKHYVKCHICRNNFEPIEGKYYTKFKFVYCGTKCLRKHRNENFV